MLNSSAVKVEGTTLVDVSDEWPHALWQVPWGHTITGWSVVVRVQTEDGNGTWHEFEIQDGIVREV